MIHLDRNHRPSPLSPNSKQNLISPATHQEPHKILAWSSLSSNDPAFDPQKSFVNDHSTDRPSDQISAQPTSIQETTTHSLTSTGVAASARSHASAPPSPDDPSSTSPNRDRSSPLSSAPDSGASHTQNENQSSPSPTQTALDSSKPEQDDLEPRAVDGASRQSTPLSELSPPTDPEDEVDNVHADATKSGGSSGKVLHGGVTDNLPKVDSSGVGKSRGTLNRQLSLMEANGDEIATIPSDTKQRKDPKPTVQTPTNSANAFSPSAFSIESPLTPVPPTSIPSTPTQVPQSDAKVVFVLQLNLELFSICIDFQKKNVPPQDPRFQQYSSRLQSNLAWLAGAADQKPGVQSNMIPIIEPPVSIESPLGARIQQLYAELRTLFASDITRRQSMLNTTPSLPLNQQSLKRDRPDDSSIDLISKRRDTGESKSPSMVMPPPSSAPSSANPQVSSQFTSMSAPASSQSPQIPDQIPAATLMNSTDPQLIARERARQMRQAAARQMSPQAQAGVNSIANPTISVGMGSSPSNPGATNTAIHNMYQILQTPGHPFVQYMMRNYPNFQALAPQAQVQRMMIAQNEMNQLKQQQQEQRQQAAQNRGQMSNNLQNGMVPPQFPHGASSMAPALHQSAVNSNPGNNMFPLVNANQVGVQGLDPRMVNSQGIPQGLNNMSVQQRQLYLMQQQSRNAGGVNPAMMMNAQQIVLAQQRLAQQGASSSHPSSPMGGNDNFAALRSNAAIPGIARSARSPSDGASSPIASRTPTRSSSMSQEDYQRMMMQQTQMAAARNIGSQNPALLQQQQQMNGGWTSQGQAQGLVGNQGLGIMPGSSNFGMATGGGGNPFVGTTSPSAGQNWSQGALSYPFSPTSGSLTPSELMQANNPHLVATQQQTSHPQDTSSQADTMLPGDFDLFNSNWAQ